MPSASWERCSNSSGLRKHVQPRLDEAMGRRIGGSPKAQTRFLDRIEGVRSPAGFAAGLTLVNLAFFAVNKQAFCNYYYFVICTCCWAVAATKTA